MEKELNLPKMIGDQKVRTRIHQVDEPWSEHAYAQAFFVLENGALISESAKIGADVSIGFGVIVGEAIIGDGVQLGDFVRVGDTCRIGDRTRVGREAVIGDTTTIGSNCYIGKYTVICGSSEVPDRVGLGVHVTVQHGADLQWLLNGAKRVEDFAAVVDPRRQQIPVVVPSEELQLAALRNS